MGCKKLDLLSREWCLKALRRGNNAVEYLENYKLAIISTANLSEEPTEENIKKYVSQDNIPANITNKLYEILHSAWSDAISKDTQNQAVTTAIPTVNIGPETNNSGSNTVIRLDAVKLDKVFDDENSLKAFIDWFRSKLILASTIDDSILGKSIVYDIKSLNYSIQDFKDKLFADLQSELLKISRDNIEPLYIKGSELTPNYQSLIGAMSNALSGYYDIKTKKYKGNSSIDKIFFKYYALTTFDSLIWNRNFNKIVTINKSAKNIEYNSNKIIQGTDKYIIDSKQYIHQNYDDSVDTGNDSVNPALKIFINSTELVKWKRGSNGEKGEFETIPGAYLTYNKFKEVIAFLRNTNATYNIGNKDNPIILKFHNLWNNFRDDPFPTIEKIFQVAADHRSSIIDGMNYELRTAFDTMYYNYFANNTVYTNSLNALDSKLNSNMSISYSLYTMLVNQIQKTSRATYVQYIYDDKNNSMEVGTLENMELDRRKYIIERNILNNHIYEKILNGLLSHIHFYKGEESSEVKDWGISNDVSKIEIVYDNIKLAATLNLSETSKITPVLFIKNNDKWVKQDTITDSLIKILTSDENSGVTKDLTKIIRDFAQIDMIAGTTMNWDIACRILTDENMSNMFTAIVASALSANYYSHSLQDNLDGTFTNTTSIGNLVNFYKANSFDTTEDWKIIDYRSKSMKISFLANNGLDALAKIEAVTAQSDIRSYVKDASNRKLQKDKLSTMQNDDQYLFNVAEGDSSKFKGIDNIFYKSNLFEGTQLKSVLSSRYSDESKDYSKATEDEANYVSFVYDFLLRSKRHQMAFQPTVYSDKASIWAKIIDTRSESIKMGGELLSLENMTANQMREVELRTTSSHAKKIVTNIFNDISQIAIALNTIKGEYISIPTHDANNITIENYKDLIYEFYKNGVSRYDIEDAIRYIEGTTGEVPTVIDQIHFIYTKEGTIDINPSLFRFLEDYTSDKAGQKFAESKRQIAKEYAYKVQRLSIEWLNSSGFKVNEVIDSISEMFPILQKSGFHSEVKNPNSTGKSELLNYYKQEWVSPSGELILFKVAGRSNNSLSFEDVQNPNVQVELNPVLNRYLAMDNLVVSNYNAIVYGLPYVHPTKKTAHRKLLLSQDEQYKKDEFFNFNDNEIRTELSQRTATSYKRAMIGGAPINTWLNGTRNGISREMKVAVIDDPREMLVNISGDKENLEVTNGALIENPFFSILSRNSVSELQQSSIHGKPICYMPQVGYGSWGILKCATHALNNDSIRNSIGKNNYRRLMKKMSDLNWLVPVQLTLKDIKWRNFSGDNVTVQHNLNSLLNPRFKHIVFDKNNNPVEVFGTIVGLDYTNSEFNSLGDLQNNYTITTQYNLKDGSYCNENGVKVKTKGEATSVKTNVNINSNYTLWEAIGGEYSIDGYDHYDNSSIEIVAAVNSKQYNLDDLIDKLKNVQGYNLASQLYSDKHLREEFNPTITTINGKKYVSPMKAADISYVAYISAVKNGATNLASTNTLYNDKSLIYSKVTTDFIGTLLSANESIDDNSDIAEMTQVISALMQRSTSQDIATQVYETIATSIINKLGVYKEAIKDNSKVKNLIGKAVLRAFDSDDLSNEGLAANFLKTILKSSGDDRLPIDDSSIYNRVATNFINGINQQVIKRRFPGILAVMSPSHDSIGVLEDSEGKIYTRSAYLSKFGKIDIKDSNIPYNAVAKIKTGDWILYNGKVTQVVALPKNEDPNVTYKTIEYDNSDTPVSYISLQQLRSEIRSSKEVGKSITVINRLGRNLRGENYNFHLSYNGTEYVLDAFDLDSSIFSYELDDIIKNRDQSNVRLKLFKNFISSHKGDTNIDSFEQVENYLKTVLEGVQGTSEFKFAKIKLRLLAREWIMSDCRSIQDEHKIPLPVSLGLNATRELVNITNVKYTPNEALLPRMMEETFKLTMGDNLNDLIYGSESEAVEFFKNKLQGERLVDFFDNNIKDADGNFITTKLLVAKDIKRSMYVVDSNQLQTIKDLLYKNKAFTKINFDIDSDGYVIDVNNNRFIKYTEGAELYYYKDNGGNIRYVLKVDNPEQDIDTIIRESPDTIKGTEESENGFKQATDISDVNKLNGNIDILARRMAISFREVATKFIVARIPAQSMQSFMNMEVKGYIDSDSNLIHVCSEQLWYQGSDFDIDKDFTLGASFDGSGSFYNWSPFFNYNSGETFRASLSLPFPKSDINYLSIIDSESSSKKGAQNVASIIENILKIKADITTNGSDEKKEVNLLSNLIRLLTLSQNGVIYITREERYNLSKNYGDKNIVDYVDTIIRSHNNYFDKNKGTYFEEALKNKIFTDIWSIGKNLTNIVSRTVPTDVKDLKDVADSTDAKMVINDNLNPSVRSMVQFQNSIGKVCIGIGAVGIKVYSSLLTYVNNKLHEKTEWTEKEWLSMLKEIIAKTSKTSEGLFTDILPGINYKSLENSRIKLANGELVNVLDYTPTDSESLRTSLKKWGVSQDVFESLSVLLSAATDNAKDPLLEKVNITPETMSIAIYLLYRGMSLKRVTDFMTSPLMNFIKIKSRTNIFSASKADAKLWKAIDFYEYGPKLRDYVPENLDRSLENVWKGFVDYARNGNVTPGLQEEVHNALKGLWRENDNGDLLQVKQRGSSNSADKITTDVGLHNPNLLKIAYPYFVRYIKEVKPQVAKNVITSQEEAEIFGVFDEEDNFYNADRSGVYNSLLLRYMNDLIARVYDIEKVRAGLRANINTDNLTEEQIEKEVDKSLDNLFSLIKEIRIGSNEASLMGSFTSLNQGIKTVTEDQLNFENSITNRISKCLNNSNLDYNILVNLRDLISKKANNQTILDVLNDNNNNDTVKYLINNFTEKQLRDFFDKDGNYRFDKKYFTIEDLVNDQNRVIEARLAEAKVFINPVAALNSNKNFKEMLDTYNTVDKFLKSVSIRRGLISKLVGILKSNELINNYSRLSGKTMTTINSFITANIADNFLNGVKLDIDSLPILENADKHYVNGILQDWTDSNKYLNLANIDDRRTFKFIMEDELLRRKDENPNNSFYNKLSTKTTTDDLGFPFPLVSLDINMELSDDEYLVAHRNIERAYSTVSTEDPQFTDALFIYDLIANKGYNGKLAFMSLFKADLKRSESFANKYMQYESKLSMNPDGFEYNLQDLFLLFNKGKDKNEDIPYIQWGNADSETSIISKKQAIAVNRDVRHIVTTLLFKNKLISALDNNDKAILSAAINRLMSEGKLQFENHC